MNWYDDLNKMRIDIVCTTWGREWMTKLCLAALRKNTATPFRLIMIDNGSEPFTQHDYLNSSDIYVKLDKNYGLEYAKNLGMKFVESEFFVSLDNDIMVYAYQPDWLFQVLKLMYEHPEYGAIAPRPQTLVADSMYIFDTPNELVDFGHVPGYARVMRTKMVNECGAWWDKREGRGHEELWIGEKFREKGYKMAWANKIKCWHLFGKEDTDEWGYPKGVDPLTHGHKPVWPMPKNDLDEIERGTGIKI